MKIITTIFIFLTISTFVFGQKNAVEINGLEFLFKQVKVDTLESGGNEIVELYRNGKKLLTHTMFEEFGDCSSIHLKLGKYEVKGNSIVFYSYWAATDRMPGTILPFGFREQIYSVDSIGKLRLTGAEIYIENFATSKNKSYLEENGWRHKGLKFLTEQPKNDYEKKLLEDYIQNIEKEYNTDFVLYRRKDELENRVRNNMLKEIKANTANWIEGEEAFGRVKK